MRDVLKFSVSEQHEGKRLDKYLAQEMDPGGRRRARFLCEQGRVQTNGLPAKKSHLLTKGTEITVSVDVVGHAAPAPEIPLVILFETEHLVIIDKPAGVPSGAVLGSEEGTMAGALLARYPEMEHVGFNRMEPGLIHRLDNQTSGVLVAAKSQWAFERLRAAMKQKGIEKRYWAMTEAQALPDVGQRTSGLAPDNRDSKRIVETHGGEQFTTSYRVLERSKHCDLVEASAHRAYRHQIRCHFAALGAALVGDELYGSTRLGLNSTKNRHALHASHIEGAAEGVERFAVSAALPGAFRELLDADA